MAKYSQEQRLKFVLAVVDKGMSTKAAAKLFGIAETHLRRLVKRYEQFGIDGLTKKYGKYAGEFKQHVIEYMHKNNLSLFETAALFGIPNDATLGKWERIYYEEGPSALHRENRGRKTSMVTGKPKKPKLKKELEEDLIAEVQRLRMENAYLKKLNALVQKRISRKNGKKQPPSTN